MVKKRRKLVRKTVFLGVDQTKQLEKLNEITRVPIAEYVREGIDMVLEKYKAQIEGKRS